MNDKETFGVELEMLISKFKSGLKEVSSLAKDFSNKVEQQMVISPTIDKKELYKWQSELQQLIDNAKINVQSFKGTPTEGKYAEELQRYSQGLEAVNERIKEIEENEKQLNEESEKTNSTFSKIFDNNIGKVKKFSFYLLGVRSAFSLFNKYRSIYYQYNEDMQYQSELSQNAIALSLAPAFEFLGNVVAYASIGIAKFIELLTGVNVLSKVTTKGIRDYNKSLKETQTLVSGIDEITNLTMPSGTGMASQYQALEDFQNKIDEVEKWFKTNPIAKFISEKLIPALKEVYDFVFIKHWDVFKYIFGGVALSSLIFKLGLDVTQMGTIAGFGAGLSGFTGALKYITGLGITAIAFSVIVYDAFKLKDLIDEYQKLQDMQQDNEHNFHKNFTDNLTYLENAVNELKNCKKGTEGWEKQMSIINGLMPLVLDKIKTGEDWYQNYIPVIQDINDELKNISDTDYTAEIEIAINTANATQEANSWWSKFKSSLSAQWNNFKTALGLDNLKYGITGRYADGLDYVPYDEYPAILHKGEAVVPAKYNPTIHSQGNEYTNSLLETMITKLDDLSNRPNVFEIDGNQFASATYNLYHNEELRQNYNTKVRVQ